MNEPTSSSTVTPSRLALPVILLAVLVMPIGISGTAVALPNIALDLGSSPALLQGVVNGFNAAFAIFMLVWGGVSDRIGYKLTFVIGTALMVLGSVLSAMAPNLALLDVGRIVCGIAGAAIFAGASATISNAYPPAARARNFAIFGATLGFGGTIGPTLTGWLMPFIGWRGVFLCLGVLVGVALLLSPNVPKLPVQVSAQPKKILDLSLFKNLRFLTFALVPVADAIGFMTLFTYLPVALRAEHGMSASASGSMLALMTIPVFVGPILVAWVRARWSRVTEMSVIYLSLVLLVLGDLGMFLLRPSMSMGWLVAPMVLLGFGWGLPAGLIDGAAIGAVPAERSGTAAGLLNFLRLGSEAVAIGAYGAGIRWAIGTKVPNVTLADDIAAGATGHGDVYAGAFAETLVVVTAMTVLLALVIAWCWRRSATQQAVATASSPEPVARPAS